MYLSVFKGNINVVKLFTSDRTTDGDTNANDDDVKKFSSDERVQLYKRPRESLAREVINKMYNAKFTIQWLLRRDGLFVSMKHYLSFHFSFSPPISI